MSESKKPPRLYHAEFNRHFSMAVNTTEDRKLGLEALGLLAYLLGKPDGWVLRTTDIMNRFGCGRDKARELVKSLIRAGYILVEEPLPHGERGRFTGPRYIISASPVVLADAQPIPPGPDLPAPVNPSPSNTIDSLNRESLIPYGINGGASPTTENQSIHVEPKTAGVDTLIRSTPPESAVEIPPDLNDKKEAATPEKPWFLWQRFVAGAHDANPDRAGALDTIEPTHMLRHMKHLIQEGVTSEVMHGAGLLWGTWRSMRKQAVVNLNVATMVTHVKLAVGMVRAGFVQSDVARLMNKLNTDPWWEDKAVSFGYVAENVQKPPAPPRLQREPEPEAPIIPTGLSVDEYVNRMMKLREEAALKAKLEELEAVK